MQKEFKRQGKLASEKAHSIEVSWIERGKRKTKLYSQSTHYYAALRFFCEDGDEFVIVMRKLHLLRVARRAMHLFRGDCTRISTLPTSAGAESANCLGKMSKKEFR